jgi:hypothetical protein
LEIDTPQKSSQPVNWRRHIWNGLLFLLAILWVVILVSVYVNQERFFYFYDFAGYQGVAQDLAYTYSQDPLAALSRLKNSLELEYNDIFAIPLLPWLLLFGESRLVYELSAALLFQLPYALALGGIAHCLVSRGSSPGEKGTSLPGPAIQPLVSPHHVSHLPRLAFWLTVFLTLASPTAWGPLLRGLPDVGAACLVSLAIWIYLHDLSLKRPWQILSIGAFLALAIIFRRHFAYAAVSFYLAVALQFALDFLFTFHKAGKSAWTKLWKSYVRLGLAALTTLITLSLLAPPFLTRVITIDYTQLYASYLMPWNDLLLSFARQYGPVALLMAISGFGLGLRTRLLARERTFFILVFGLVISSIWILMARQGSYQYTLHFTFLVILGISCLLLVILILPKPALRRWLALAVAGFLALNAFSGLFVPANSSFSRLLSKSGLLSTAYLPMVRSDYAEVTRMVEYLHGKVPPGDPLYAVDSSYTLNADLIEKAEKLMFGRSQAHLNILPSPIIDSRDSYPLESLLEAQFIVLSTPPQYHLNSGEQEVIGVTYDIFQQGWEIAQDFVLLPESFSLAEGSVTTRVYQRLRPTSEQTAILTFDKIRQQIKDRPGSQLDWVNLGLARLGIVRNKHGRFTTIHGSTHPEQPVEMNFLYIEEPPVNGSITGRVEWNKKACKGLILEAVTTDSSREPLASSQIEMTKRIDSFSLPFQKNSPAGESTAYLLLRARTNQGGTPENACTVRIYWTLQE